MPEPELVPVPFHTPAAGGEWWINQNNIRGDALRQEVIYEFGIMTGWIEADNSCKLPSLGIYFVRNDCRSRRPCPNRQTARPQDGSSTTSSLFRFNRYVAKYAIGAGVENC